MTHTYRLGHVYFQYIYHGWNKGKYGSNYSREIILSEDELLTFGAVEDTPPQIEELKEIGIGFYEAFGVNTDEKIRIVAEKLDEVIRELKRINTLTQKESK